MLKDTVDGMRSSGYSCSYFSVHKGGAVVLATGSMFLEVLLVLVEASGYQSPVTTVTTRYFPE